MWNTTLDESTFSRSSSYRECREDEEEALRWAALERLPTFDRVRRGILLKSDGDCSEVEVSGLGPEDHVAVIERLLSDGSDAEKFLRRIRQRFDR